MDTKKNCREEKPAQRIVSGRNDEGFFARAFDKDNIVAEVSEARSELAAMALLYIKLVDVVENYVDNALLHKRVSGKEEYISKRRRLYSLRGQAKHRLSLLAKDKGEPVIVTQGESVTLPPDKVATILNILIRRGMDKEILPLREEVDLAKQLTQAVELLGLQKDCKGWYEYVPQDTGKENKNG